MRLRYERDRARLEVSLALDVCETSTLSVAPATNAVDMLGRPSGLLDACCKRASTAGYLPCGCARRSSWMALVLLSWRRAAR